MRRRNLGIWVGLAVAAAGLAVIFLSLPLLRSAQTAAGTAAPATSAAMHSPAPSQVVPAPDLPPVNPPPGLLISQAGDLPGAASIGVLDSAGVFQPLADLDGLPVAYYDPPLFRASLDGTALLYESGEDLWRLDLATGTAQNLTSTPDIRETEPQDWPAHPGSVLFVAREEGAAPSLAALAPDGSRAVIQQGITFFAASPSGQEIAFPIGGSANPADPELALLGVYRPDGTVEQIDPASFGLPGLQWIADLSWSPDGARIGLAGLALNEQTGQQQPIIAVLDLTARTSRVLLAGSPNQSTHLRLNGSAPQWSPAGDWSIFFMGEGTQEEQGLWIAEGERIWQVDVSSLGDHAWNWAYTMPFISPDGQWIAAQGYGEAAVLLRAGEWQIIPWESPSGPVEGWVRYP